MENRVQELLDELYSMIQDAWGLPLGAEKCVVERDKVLDILDEIRAQLPGELAEARRIMEDRSQQINNAKREAENIRKNAEEQAKRMLDQQELVAAARSHANAIVSEAENKSAELRRVANEYADDALRRTEEAIGEALNEVRGSRNKFRAASAALRQNKTSETDIEI